MPKLPVVSSLEVDKALGWINRCGIFGDFLKIKLISKPKSFVIFIFCYISFILYFQIFSFN
jgi:hypothetical protein